MPLNVCGRGMVAWVTRYSLWLAVRLVYPHIVDLHLSGENDAVRRLPVD